jgi:hypothetical protein
MNSEKRSFFPICSHLSSRRLGACRRQAMKHWPGYRSHLRFSKEPGVDAEETLPLAEQKFYKMLSESFWYPLFIKMEVAGSFCFLQQVEGHAEVDPWGNGSNITLSCTWPCCMGGLCCLPLRKSWDQKCWAQTKGVARFPCPFQILSFLTWIKRLLCVCVCVCVYVCMCSHS